MRLPALALALTVFTVSGYAQLRITEAMSSSASSTPDWIEITNYGNVSITLDSNWRIDDSNPTFGSSIALNGNFVVAPGESVVFLEGNAAAVTAFNSLWQLSGVQVGFYSGSGIGLSSGGDAVNLYSGSTIYTGVSFGGATTGSSFFWTYSNDGSVSLSGGPSLSTAGQFGAVSRGSDTGSPGTALALTAPSTLQWVGGGGTWAASGGTAWQGGAWNGQKTAVFSGSGGTVTLNENIAALGLDIRGDDYVIAGSGSINTAQASVVNSSDTAVINVAITGTQGFTKFGAGTLEFGAQNTFEGATSVSQGTVRSTVNDALPDSSLLNVARFATYDFNDHSDTVAGIAGLGTVDMGNGDLTVNITGTANAELNGSLHGSGDFIVDSSGSGDQVFNTTGQSLSDGAVKDYTGATIIRNGVLRVNETAIPVATSEVLIEGGKLRLTSELAEYTFGTSAATEVVLAGGAIRQDDGESVTLNNAVKVTADSEVESIVDAEDPFSAPVVTLAGTVSGTGGLKVSGGGQVDVITGGSYSGTISVESSKLRVNGVLNAGTVILDADSSLSGSGSVGKISGGGKISPGNSPGILTAGSVDPGAGTDFAFEFTSQTPNYADASFSNNDLLRITGANPLEAGLSGGNTVEIFLSFASLTEGDFFLGGFYLDQFESFDSLIAGADFVFYISGDGGGTAAFLDGFGYYELSNFLPELNIAISSVAAPADFGGGLVEGGVMQLTVVPEPGAFSLIFSGVCAMSLLSRRRMRRPVNPALS